MRISAYTISVLLCITTVIWASGGGRRGMGFFDVMLIASCLGKRYLLPDRDGTFDEIMGTQKLRSIILGAVFFFFGILPALPLGKICLGNGYASESGMCNHKAISVSECW